MFRNDTITAAATPPGEGGIAVIRVSGAEAVAIAARLFVSRKRKNLTSAAGYTVRYGRFIEGEGDVIDDGLVTVFRAPHSYTGEDTVELSCHGGRAVTDRLLASVMAAGARLAEPGEFTLRAFLNGRIDLAQAEAVADLIRARTDGARRVARRQLDGNLSRAVRKVRDELIGVVASIEVTIDFSDEVGDLDYGALRASLSRARADLEHLLATSERGRILREGLRVAIVGPPNVGKSSLLNALLRADRAIVTPIAGTTRDLIEESADIAGVRVVLVDTAGMRETNDMIERIGVARAQQAAEGADVTLVVLDAAQPAGDAEESLISERIDQYAPEPGSGRLLVALNKCDIVAPGAAERRVGQLAERFGLESAPFLISALTGAGIALLEAALVYDATRVSPAETGVEDAVVAAARHREALVSAYTNLAEAERTALRELPGDFVAIDVRGALDALGRITGETVNDEIIHRIFRDFCVGK